MAGSVPGRDKVRGPLCKLINFRGLRDPHGSATVVPPEYHGGSAVELRDVSGVSQAECGSQNRGAAEPVQRDEGGGVGQKRVGTAASRPAYRNRRTRAGL
jgi:hypothetical protein